MARFDRSALRLGIASLALTMAAATLLWWRWERPILVDGDVPLPPRSRVVETSTGNATPGSGTCQVTAYTPLDGAAVESFFATELARRGWSGPEPSTAPSDPRPTFRSADRVLRLAVRPRAEIGRTNYTVTLRPCAPE